MIVVLDLVISFIILNLERHSPVYICYTKIYFLFILDLSNDEEEEEEEIEPPNKAQRSRHLYNQQHSNIRKKHSATPENLTDDQISFHRSKNQIPENYNSFEGSQGSLFEKNSSRNSTLERQHIKIGDKIFLSSRSSSSSSHSEAGNELIGYRRSKPCSSSKSSNETRIRRSR